MHQSLDDWVEGYKKAWEERDPAAASALFSTNATYRSNIFEDAHQARKGVEYYWQTVTESQTDISVRMGRPLIDGSRAAVEFWTTMKVNGDQVTLAGCLLLHFDDDGLCSHLREYWHLNPGLNRPPTGWGT